MDWKPFKLGGVLWLIYSLPNSVRFIAQSLLFCLVALAEGSDYEEFDDVLPETMTNEIFNELDNNNDMVSSKEYRVHKVSKLNELQFEKLLT